MSASAAYLDTSAFLKLVVAEAESAALRRFLLRWPDRTSASLLRTETIGALRRAGYDQHVGHARRLFRTIRLIALDELLLDRAAELDPRELRSLDAIHLAAAMLVGSDLGAFVTYDQRLAAAAQDVGLPVHSPR
ncbi:MAG: type II toxin-antitoxin system VapC family toxin [Chloroflexi bacterium]|nr:type II toxin-antitoxin system VapC family toxin [Chloroflexota bacterium]